MGLIKSLKGINRNEENTYVDFGIISMCICGK